ncbi:hypothetical protein [Halorussus litoreus]|uniref:hypothetical protein n=1 Tax=Halorussus litoreus TaxID=1710536 RepID=UPI001300174E|nr:hypothetical protein [Halorussus litoreus]
MRPPTPRRTIGLSVGCARSCTVASRCTVTYGRLRAVAQFCATASERSHAMICRHPGHTT